MSAGKGKSTASIKISFGVRRRGKAQKSYGPKVSKPKKYRGQGK
jgi:hypothetical protein